MKTHSLLPRAAKDNIALLSVCFASLFLTTVQPAVSESIIWRTLAPMPTPRYDFGTAVVDGKVYAIGGFSGSTLAVNEMFDPETGSWVEKTPMPTARALHVVAAVDGKIYAIGGIRWDGNGLACRACPAVGSSSVPSFFKPSGVEVAAPVREIQVLSPSPLRESSSKPGVPWPCHEERTQSTHSRSRDA